MGSGSLELIVVWKIVFGFLSDIVVLAIVLAAILAIAWGIAYVGAHISDGGDHITAERRKHDVRR
jgi:hypothetical protein